MHDNCEEKDLNEIEDNDQYDDENITIRTKKRTYQLLEPYVDDYEDEDEDEEDEDNSINRIKRCNSPCELSTNEIDQCGICYINKKRYVCIPCGHLCMCGECANKIKDVCPICRKNVSNIIKTY